MLSLPTNKPRIPQISHLSPLPTSHEVLHVGEVLGGRSAVLLAFDLEDIGILCETNIFTLIGRANLHRHMTLPFRIPETEDAALATRYSLAVPPNTVTHLVAFLGELAREVSFLGSSALSDIPSITITYRLTLCV